MHKHPTYVHLRESASKKLHPLGLETISSHLKQIHHSHLAPNAGTELTNMKVQTCEYHDVFELRGGRRRRTKALEVYLAVDLGKLNGIRAASDHALELCNCPAKVGRARCRGFRSM
jgi:hypothetical protein